LSRFSRQNGAVLGRAGLAAAGVAVILLLPVLLAGRSELAEWGAELGLTDDAPADSAVVAAAVEADIVVVRGGRSRAYSSHQLPPDGRRIFARFASDRYERSAKAPPVDIAAWIFRVVPDADEIRITVREHRPDPESGRIRTVEAPYEYRRETFTPS
jgi:hypothetical protein